MRSCSIMRIKQFLTTISLMAVFTLFVWPHALGQGGDADSGDIESEPLKAVNASRPNIIFILADDLGYGDIGVFGADDIETPFIDSLARSGAKFTNFYSASPVCTPSRAGFLTGRYPIRMGIHHVFFPGSYQGMPEDEITIAEVLKNVGYATSIIGKWHLGHRQRFLPLRQGFDEFFGIPYSNDMSPLPMMHGNDFVEPSIDQTQLTRRLTEEAVDFVGRHADRPFFLYLAHPMPHAPLFRSGGFENSSKRGVYGDVVRELDWSVGEILAALDEHGIANQTLVIFTSDNGPWLLMGDKGGSAGLLRGGKETTFEGGMRVPMLAKLPGVIPPGKVIDAPAIMLDWFPTFARLAGASLPEDRSLDGKDLAPLWRGESKSYFNERMIAYYSHGELQAARVGDWKLKRPYNANKAIPGAAILRWFLPHGGQLRSHGTLLFDLSEDPSENRNLAKNERDKIAELNAAIDVFEAEIGDTPPAITNYDFNFSPAMRVMAGAAIKFVLLVLFAVLAAAAALAYWLGSRRRRANADH